MTKRALGKGFDGLIPTNFDVGSVASPGEHIKQVLIGLIVANPEQPRKVFDATALEELAKSIKQHGIIQPLVVTPHENMYRIVAGERRYRAAKIAKLQKLPVIIRNHKELEELEIALVENVQRVDLSPLETALSIVRLRDQFSLSPKEIAQKLGKAETTISNTMRLLHLPKEAVEALQTNTITEGHARAILSLRKDEKAQRELLSTIVTHKLSVREAEGWVKNYKIERTEVKTISPGIQSRIQVLEKKLHSTIKIEHKKRGGSLSFSYKDDDQLNAILEKLATVK